MTYDRTCAGLPDETVRLSLLRNDATDAGDTPPTSLNRILFDAFSPRIAALPSLPAYEKRDLLVPRFRLHGRGDLAVYYAPFDHVNLEAKVVLVGITPGWTQMEIGYREARKALLAGEAKDVVCQRAKAQASFAGPMRRNLVLMLDGIGLPQALGIPLSDALVGPATALLHTTSAIRYPVFIYGENYTGHRPKPLGTPILRDMVRTLLVEELQQIPDALIIPLGASLDEAIKDLVEKHAVDSKRCLTRFPHPSGGNGHRVRQFAERRLPLQDAVEAWFTRSQRA